jgi:AcrR family transcriptional regulator
MKPVSAAVTKPNRRRSAVQARSRATVDRILNAAIAVIVEKGAERATMTEIAQRADVVIGSLYQYFSEKREILKAILEAHNVEVEVMLRGAFSGVTSKDDFVAAMDAIAQGYFHQHRTSPLYRSIWSAVQTDAELQALDVQDSLAKARILFDIARPLYRKVDETDLMSTCALLMQTALTAARFALAIPRPLGKRTLGVYQNMCRSLFLALEQAPQLTRR